MFKQKIKFALIDDYIKLLKIDKFLCLNANNIESLKFNQKLKTSYENLLFKYGLMDVSLLVLKKEIQSCEFGGGLTIENVKQMQQNIVDSLISKIKQLKLNEIESTYLTKSLNVKNC